MSKTGFFLVGVLAGFVSEPQRNSQYVNYKCGVRIEGRPDAFGIAQDEVITLTLQQNQYQQLLAAHSGNIGKPVRVPVYVWLRSGVSAAGKPYAFNEYRIVSNGEIELLSPAKAAA